MLYIALFSLFTSLQLIPKECTVKKEFCKFFDSLFNAFNSASLISGKPFNWVIDYLTVRMILTAF